MKKRIFFILLLFAVCLSTPIAVNAMEEEQTKATNNTYSITLPKTISMGNAKTKIFDYSVSGYIGDFEHVVVSVENNYSMKRKNDESTSVQGTASINKTSFSQSELWSNTSSTGQVSSNPTKAGTYSGNVVFHTSVEMIEGYHWIIYDANGGGYEGGSYYGGKIVATGSKYGDLPTPVRTGYTFTGWYTAVTGGTKVTADTIMQDKDITIYAQWEKDAVLTTSSGFNQLYINKLYRIDNLQVVFTDETAPVDVELTDLSENQDGSIVGFFDRNNPSVYKISTQDQGTKIYANQDSSGLFYDWRNLKDISFDNFDTSKVTSMRSMFSSCSNLTTIDVSSFNTSKVRDMSSMFNYCTGLTTLDVSSFDTSNVTDMSSMFYQCTGLTTLDVSGFDTSNVTDMRSMFSGCSGLTTIEVSSFDTSKVMDMRLMFDYCTGLTTLDVSSFDTSNVISMSSMFYQCTGLTILDVSGFDTSKVRDMSSMFNYCTGLTTLDVSSFDTSNVTDMSSMFYQCTGLTTLDVSGFDTSNVTDMRSMFSGCSGLTTIEVSSFNTSKVMDMGYMFSDCSNLTALDVSGFDTSKVTSMRSMFNYCTGLTTLDLSSFDTSEVTSMRSMFNYCTGLTTLDLSSFDTSNVTDMSSMFYQCTGLTTLDLSSFNTSNVTDMNNMFINCKKIQSNITIANPNIIYYDMFYGCSTEENSYFRVDYKSNCKEMAEKLVETANSPNVYLGSLVN